MCRTGQSQPSTREAAKTENRFARLIGTGRPASAESTCWWPLQLAVIKAAKATGRPAVSPCHHLNLPSAARVVVHRWPKNPHSWPEQRERAKACRFDCRKICTRQRHRSGFSAVKRVLSRESAQHHQPRLPSASADIKQASRSPEGLSQAREESSYGALVGLQKSHGKAVRMLTRF